MHRATQLQFQRLPPEARRATLWRLAWSGLTPEQIAKRTGWTAEQVRRAMHDELAPALPTWAQRSEPIAVNA
jgi:DNA-directed RNA polymerase specialized sigma24 family protein